MTNINKLINQLATKEKLLSETEFLAPCVKRGLIRTSIDHIIYTFIPQPEEFEGWGVFQPIDNKKATLIEEPILPQIGEYLQLLKPLRLRLSYALNGQTWLAYPVNESDMQQRFGVVKPIAVYLVTEGEIFSSIIARFDGNCWWFDEVDRRADFAYLNQLLQFWQQQTPSENVRFTGMTPEMWTNYDLAWQQTDAYHQRKQHRHQIREGIEKPIITRGKTDEQRLRSALKQGGGALERFRDRHDFWQVEWRTSDGEFHTSAISKDDLTVISSGICLSGGDRHFDLQSLVGVIEKRDFDWE